MINFSTQGGIDVDRPWQDLHLPDVTLASGWYVLRIAGADCAVCLQLRDVAGHSVVELPATSEQPAYIRLMAGTYAVRLIPSVRPGHLGLTGVRLEPMTLFDRLSLLSGRFIKALAHGQSLATIAALVGRALQAKGTFGVRAASGDGLGALTQADRHRAWRAPQDVASRLARLTNPPRFCVRMSGGAMQASGLEQQVYPHWTTQADTDWEVVLSPGERLTPDALLLFAEAIAANDALHVVIADRWEGHRLASRIAFDPLFYAAGLPTPHAVRKGTDRLLVEPWARQMPAFAALGLPVAAVERAQPPTPAPPLAPPPQGLVSVIIPTRDRAVLLGRCLASLAISTWPSEIVIVDNGSVEPETFALFERVRAAGGKVVRDDGAFNFSRLSNLGAAAARGDYFLFMNNDVELINDAITPMVTYAALPDVGAVGARLLYADGSLQHGGVALGLTEVCGHLWRHLPEAAQVAVARISRTSLRAAVTGALMCVARSKFQAVAGFDEKSFPVTLNDVDLCLRLMQRGGFSVYCADARAWHHEGSTRGEDLDEGKRQRRRAELDAFVTRWGDWVADDPWLPAAASRAGEAFHLR